MRLVVVLVLVLLGVGVVATGTRLPSVALARRVTRRPTKPKHVTKSPTVPVDPTTACAVDGDCTFIPDPSCCPMCRRAAANVNMVPQYIAKHKCNQTDVVCPLACILDLRVAICEQNTCVLRNPNEIPCGGFVMNGHMCPAGYSCYKKPGTLPDLPGRCMPQVPCNAKGTCDSPLDTCDAASKLCTFTNPGNLNLTALAACGPDGPCADPTLECVQNPADYCIYGRDFDCKGVCVPSNACDGVRCGSRRKCIVCPQPGFVNPKATCVAKSATSCPSPRHP